MDKELTGQPPRAQTLDEANALIAQLWQLIEQLRGELSDLKEKRKTNSKNSSQPPSKDKSSKNKSNAKRNADRKKKGRTRGGQKGHDKHLRELLPTEQVDHTIACLPQPNCSCGHAFIGPPELHRRHQQYEFPVIKPIVTEYQLYRHDCEHCNKCHIASLPSGVSWSMLGPRATAMTAHLSGTYRISKQNIVYIYDDLFNFRLSTGMVCKAEKTVSNALEQPIEEATTFVQSANNVSVHADETGFKEKGKKMWAWVAISCLVTVFMIRKRRSKAVAKELLGQDFKGILCSDRYSAYNWVATEKRQLCWAHLERDFRKISERSGMSQAIGDELLELTYRLFHHWHDFKSNIINRTALQTRTQHIRERVHELLEQGRDSKHKKTAGTCCHLLKYENALWRFLDTEGVEPTNNLAEQKIRPLVIWMKTSFGTQSERGSLYMERIMSTVATCRLQSRNILHFLTEAVQCYVEKSKPPSLLPGKCLPDQNMEELAA